MPRINSLKAIRRNDRYSIVTSNNNSLLTRKSDSPQVKSLLKEMPLKTPRASCEDRPFETPKAVSGINKLHKKSALSPGLEKHRS